MVVVGSNEGLGLVLSVFVAKVVVDIASQATWDKSIQVPCGKTYPIGQVQISPRPHDH